MIQQQVGDLLEIQFRRKYYYVVVLTKIVMFGGNIVFAYHNDGKRRKLPDLLPPADGFNVCTDLLWPKRDGKVSRLHRFENVAPFWLTKYAKATHEHRLGVKAKDWFIYRIDDLGGDDIGRVSRLSKKYRQAMDRQCSSFDLVWRQL